MMSNLAGVAAAVPPRRLLIRLRLRLLHAVSVTGVLPVLVRLPSAREGHRAETGATLMETNASPVAAAAGAAGRLRLRLRLRLLHAVSVTGVLPVLVRLPSAREGHRAETGATLMETNASPVAAAAGAAGRLRLRLRLLHAVSVTGVLPVLVRLPSAREGHRAETGATLMETDASLDAAAAGALETVKFRKREWCRVCFNGCSYTFKTDRREK
jgi:uncharacterized Zn-binding protein involved in type VI secretion